MRDAGGGGILLGVAEVVLTPGERRRIAEVLEELTRVGEGFFGDARSRLSADEWTLLVGYAAACVRRVLEVGTSLRAVVAAHEGGAASGCGAGGEAFVRAAMRAWVDSYATIEDVWRVSLLFDRIPGGEKRVMAEVAVLEAMAANRMFTSLDEECARFLSSGP